MKKKFLVLTLCFTLLFSSFNYKKSYADMGVISAPILATVATMAVATGVVINNDADLYSLGNMFYNYNKDVWDSVVLAFNSSVAFNKVTNKLTVGKDFLDIFKNCFSSAKSGNLVGQYGAIPIYDSHPSFDLAGFSAGAIISKDNIYNFGDFEVTISNGDASAKYKGNSFGKTVINAGAYPISLYIVKNSTPQYGLMCVQQLSYDKTYVSSLFGWLGKGVILEYPNFNTYDDSKIKDNDSIGVYVPSDLGDLKGVSSDEIIGSSAPPWASNGVISFPSVDNPSISVDGDLNLPGSIDSDIPGVDSPSVPSDGIWSTVKDFVVGLVVPSDTFWTDTWGGLYNNFTNSFPMVDMDGFNDLITGEKKFPNIDIDIMGVTGRVVNGDVINSIADWLRPIIAGFIMICLMLFNYRKIYKLIRNSEPFEGVGKVENHAN